VSYFANCRALRVDPNKPLEYHNAVAHLLRCHFELVQHATALEKAAKKNAPPSEKGPDAEPDALLIHPDSIRQIAAEVAFQLSKPGRN